MPAPDRTDALVARIKGQDLNRPDTDDLLSDADYYDAIDQAVKKIREKVAAMVPGYLKQTDTVTSTDDGETYDLADISGVSAGDHLGDIDVWTPPGPPDGYVLGETNPRGGLEGYWLEGNVLHLTYPKDYSPGLYVRWIPAEITQVDADGDGDAENDPDLPARFDTAIRYYAAAELASRPGLVVDHNALMEKFRREWRGDRNDPSDIGLLGILKASTSSSGSAHLRGTPSRWWSGIRSAH